MKKTLPLTLLGLAAFGLWKPEPATAAAATPGMLARLDRDGSPGEPCPLEHTAVDAQVHGPVARVRVKQIFRNPGSDPVEALYVFPLAAGGAVDGMTLRIGDREVRGTILKKEEARAIYNRARSQGKLAGLLDQQRPNVFLQSVANIPPGAKVEVEIEYVEALRFEAGRYEFAFPMTVGPRYNPAASPDAFQNPTYAAAGMRAGHDLSMKVRLDAGLVVSAIDSPTHEVVVSNRSDRAALIELRNQKEIPNKDFLLRWDVTGAKIGDAVLAHRAGNGPGHFTLVLAPPDAPARADRTPKELIFVIDTSGSMHGFPLDKAKEAMMAAMDGLYPEDRFNLITFAGDTHLLFPQPVSGTRENIASAKQFLAGRRGGGGTEMMKAIRAALAPSDSTDHVRIVCFMTDGYVGNEEQILSEIRKHSNARVFGFGIGSSVNRHLMDRMSAEGRGEVEYVGLQDDGSAAAKRFHERVRTPLLTDIELVFDGITVDEILPRRLPDLFSAKPVVVHGRYQTPGRGFVTVRGKMGGEPFTRRIAVTLPAVASRDGLGSLWARAKVTELTAEGDGLHREAITKLGLDYRLLTPFTSFVAVEHRTISEGGRLRTVEVPVEVPEGVDGEMAGAYKRAGSPMPAMAMASPRALREDVSSIGGARPMPKPLPEPVVREERDRGAQMPRLEPSLRPKMTSPDKVGIRIYLRDASDAVLAKLKAAGFVLVARPGGGRLVIGEVTGDKLSALLAIAEVSHIAPR